MRAFSVWADRIASMFVALLYMNLLFLLFSLPIITIPGAVAALFGGVHIFVTERRVPKFKEFAGVFRTHFVVGLVVSLITVVAIAPVFLDFVLVWKSSSVITVIVSVPLWFCVFIYLVTFIYLYPVLVRQNFHVKGLVLNSFKLGMYKFHLTILNIAVIFLLVIVGIYLPLVYITVFFSVSAGLTYWLASVKLGAVSVVSR